MYVRWLLRNTLRLLEKIPGVNLVQTVEVGSFRFLMTPKVATRTLRDLSLSFRGLDEGDRSKAWMYVEYHTRSRYVASVSKRDVIILRSPMSRLHSCWKQKFSLVGPSKVFYFWQYWPLLYPNQSFESFLRRISILPPSLCEKHFIPALWNLQEALDKATLVAIEDLDEFLIENQLVKETTRANTTQSLKISGEAREIYLRYLTRHYLLDEQYYALTVKKNADA